MRSFKSRVSQRPCRTPQTQHIAETGFARRLPLRPTRIVFLHEVDPRDGRHPVEGAPWSGVRRWRGTVEAPPFEGWVPVVLSEIPNGRTATTNLEVSLFQYLNISIHEGFPIELVQWIDERGEVHLRLEAL